MADLRRRAPRNGLEKAIWFSKIGFFLVGILSVGMLARLAVPPAAGVLASALPRVWASLGSWLAPPYLFVVIHLIILVIWKLSDQRQQHHRYAWPVEERLPVVADVVKIKRFEPPPDMPLPPELSPDAWHEILPSPMPAEEIKTFEPPPALHLPPEPSHKAWREILASPTLALFAESGASRPPSDASTKEIEKPAAWSAFEIKTSIEEQTEISEALKEIEFVAAAESMVENDSLEATWEAIVEKSPRNGEKPAIRQQPWRPPTPAESMVENDSMEATWKAIMEKSPRNGEKPATRRSRQEPRSPEPQPLSPVAIRGRLPSVTGRDELNQRCDEFIKKRYHQIRLQRHESNQRRLEMVNARSH